MEASNHKTFSFVSERIVEDKAGYLNSRNTTTLSSGSDCGKDERALGFSFVDLVQSCMNGSGNIYAMLCSFSHFHPLLLPKFTTLNFNSRRRLPANTFTFMHDERFEFRFQI